MRILDKNGNELQPEFIDYEKGYLEEEKILIARHEAVAGVEEQGHWVTVKEYPNGGKEVEWAVDVPGVEPQEAWDEYEEIRRFTAYTAEQLSAFEREMQRQARLEALIESAVLREELGELVKKLLTELLTKGVE